MDNQEIKAFEINTLRARQEPQLPSALPPQPIDDPLPGSRIFRNHPDLGPQQLGRHFGLEVGEQIVEWIGQWRRRQDVDPRPFCGCGVFEFGHVNKVIDRPAPAHGARRLGKGGQAEHLGGFVVHPAGKKSELSLAAGDHLARKFELFRRRNLNPAPVDLEAEKALFGLDFENTARRRRGDQPQ